MQRNLTKDWERMSDEKFNLEEITTPEERSGFGMSVLVAVTKKYDELKRREKLLEEQLKIARNFMDMLAIHYNHPMHDHNWAYYVFEKAKTANNAIDKLESNKP